MGKKQLNLYFCNVETNELYKLGGWAAKELMETHPNFSAYLAGDRQTKEVYEFFKTHGQLICNSSELGNLFIGFVY